MQISTYYFSCYFYNDGDDGRGFWIRVFGYGINVRNTPMLFSERNGHSWYLPIGNGYRFSFLSKSGGI